MEKQLIEAAERGHAEAQFNLAMVCENGVSDSRYTNEGNHSEAMRWLLAAATQGLPRAQVKLAELYAAEPPTLESSITACGWYLVATANLDGIRLRQAQTAYRRISERLTPAENAEAKKFADDWRPMQTAMATGSRLRQRGPGAGT